MRPPPFRSPAPRQLPSGPRDAAPSPQDFASWIVWQDAHLIAVDKPAGVLSQGGEGGAGINLVDLARTLTGLPSIGVLHRLDRNVSGLVLLAKDPRAARGLSLEIQRGRLGRSYEAVVYGSPPADSFVIEAALRKDSRTNEVAALEADDLAALPESLRREYKPSRTEVRLIERFRAPIGGCARLDVTPITGRSHQIRVHLAHLGLPIVGDPKYGVEARDLRRPLLHARQLRFRHPITNVPIALEAPVPWDASLLRSLARWR